MPYPSPGLLPSSSVFPGIPGGAATVPAGKFVLTNAKVAVAGVDVSRYCHEISVKLDREEIDVTPLGATYKQYMPGPTTGTFTVGMHHDPTVHTPAFWSTLTAPFTIEVAPRNFPAAPDNPIWTATVIAVKRTHLTGTVGDAAATALELRSSTAVLEDIGTSQLYPSTSLYPALSLYPA